MTLYEKILVPLDGSKDSESIIDHVRMLAKSCGAPKVVLLRVVEPFSPSAVNILGPEQASEVQQKTEDAAGEYLSYVADSLRTHCGGVDTVVIEGNPAEAIIRYADENGVDLIAMSTHGESGPTRWAVGSVTQRVLQHSKAPLLTMIPGGHRQ